MFTGGGYWGPAGHDDEKRRLNAERQAEYNRYLKQKEQQNGHCRSPQHHPEEEKRQEDKPKPYYFEPQVSVATVHHRELRASKALVLNANVSGHDAMVRARCESIKLLKVLHLFEQKAAPRKFGHGNNVVHMYEGD
eukprot:9474663-Pyramimonas_sp.AAC.1